MPLVSTEDRAAVRVITYANAPFGTMTAAGAAEMFHAVAAAGEDPSARAIIITGGIPGIFIRHYDVGELSDAADATERGAPRPPSPSGPRPPGFHALTDLIAAVEKPVIAAINGLCMGGGFELSLACDLRIAGNAVPSIGLPETRIGIFPGGGGTQRFRRLKKISLPLNEVARFLGSQPRARLAVIDVPMPPRPDQLISACDARGLHDQQLIGENLTTRESTGGPEMHFPMQLGLASL